jgi:predicted ATPase/DNA-binding XRE family transcriptional regulator
MPTETAPASFGARLRHHRLAAGLSQEELAEQSGLSVRAISDLERGVRRFPYPHTIAQLAVALGLGDDARRDLAAAARRRLGGDGPRAGADQHGARLPLPATSFVGRARELAEVRCLLGASRLVTLTGVGGCGKTRLALETARAIERETAGEVRLVDLAPLAEPGLVPQAVARALPVPEQPGRPLLDALTAWLAGQRLLLVLDNCEHLLDACAGLAAAVLRACPDVRLLVTSREALGVAGERAWPVPPLALPPAGAGAGRRARGWAEAVQLFVERAAVIRPGFGLTDQNAAAVAEVCRRLDGLPLAIELAAARLNVLTVEQLADRLGDRFRLLTGGSRTALPRQQTLQATLDWSYALLTEPEQAMLRRLAVFAGGCSLAAAEAVCPGAGVEPADVLDLLGRLVAKSLVVMEEQPAPGDHPEARYRLLETVRQYAAERLLEAGEERAVRERHRDWGLALAERGGSTGSRRALVAWLDHLDAEYDNLRAALGWCLEHEPPAALRLVSAIDVFWQVRVHYSEALRWLSRALTESPERTGQRARVLLTAGKLLRMQGEHARARAWDEEALAISRRLADPRLIAAALGELGGVCFWSGDFDRAGRVLAEGLTLARSAPDAIAAQTCLYFAGRLAAAQGDYPRARTLLAEALDLWRQERDLAGLATPLRELGIVALWAGDADRARSLVTEALAGARQAGAATLVAIAQAYLGQIAAWQGELDRAGEWFETSLAAARAANYGHLIALSLLGLGQIAVRRGEAARAVALLEESLTRCDQMDYRPGRAATLHWLGLAAWRQGAPALALVRLGESLGLRRGMGERLGLTECLEALATVAAGTGRSLVAAQLLGAAEAGRAAIGAPLPPADRAEHAATAQAARAALGDDAFAAAWAAGQALTLDQAAAGALAVTNDR